MGKRVSPPVLPTVFREPRDTTGRLTLTTGVVTVQVIGNTAALPALVASVLAIPVLQPQAPVGVKVTVTLGMLESVKPETICPVTTRSARMPGSAPEPGAAMVPEVKPPPVDVISVWTGPSTT